MHRVASTLREQRTFFFRASTFCANFLTAASSPDSGRGISCARHSTALSPVSTTRQGQAQRGPLVTQQGWVARLQAVHKPTVCRLELLKHGNHNILFLGCEPAKVDLRLRRLRRLRCRRRLRRTHAPRRRLRRTLSPCRRLRRTLSPCLACAGASPCVQHAHSHPYCHHASEPSDLAHLAPVAKQAGLCRYVP